MDKNPNHLKKNFSLVAKIILPLLILGYMGAVLLYQKAPKSTPEAPVVNSKKVVEVVPVASKSIQEAIPFLGTLKATQSAHLRAKAQGIIEFLAPEGALLKQGDLIAEIHPKHLMQKHKILQEAEHIALEQWKRATLLTESGITPKSTLEERYQELLRIQKEINALQLEDLKVEAPFDGNLSLRKISNGTEVFIGDELIHIYNPNHLRLEFDIPQNIAEKITSETKIQVAGKLYPIAFMDGHLDPKKVMCKAYAELPKDFGSLIGTTIALQLILREKSDAIVIPRDALFFKKGRIMVYTVENEKVCLNPVKLGITQEKEVEVVYGLELGELLVVKGHQRLYPEMEVEIHQEA